MDADKIINADSLPRLVVLFLKSDDIVATGATVRVANGCKTQYGRIVEEHSPKTALGGLQAIEYFAPSPPDGSAWNWMGGNLVISPAPSASSVASSRRKWRIRHTRSART